MSLRLVLFVSMVLVVAPLLSGSRGHAQEGTAATPTPTVAAYQRTMSGHLPPGCGLAETVQHLTDFLAAFNRGDETALPQFFPEEGVFPHSDKRGFQWYSVSDQNGGFVTYDPAELPAYFAARHEQHERLQLLELEVAGSVQLPYVSIVYRLSRDADDLPLHEAAGKGAVYCDDHTILVWSMGQILPNEATPQGET